MRVSVCIPTVNRAWYLKDALESLAAQTFSDFEVLIADNSADESYRSLVATVISEFPTLSLRLFHHPKRISMVENANFLVEKSIGEFWIYLPDDDRMRPECLDVLVKALDSNPEAGFSFSDHWIIRSDGKPDPTATNANTRAYKRLRLRSGLIQHEDLFELALNQSFHLQSMLFRQEVIKSLRFNPERGDIPDFDLQLRIAQSVRIRKAYYCTERLVEYRLHDEQFTASKDARDSDRQIIASLENCSNVLPRFGRHFRRKLASHHLGLAIKEFTQGNDIETRAQIRKSLTLQPGSVMAHLYFLFFQLPHSQAAKIQRLARFLRQLALRRAFSHSKRRNL